MEQPNLLMLIGIPGCGKSSWLAGFQDSPCIPVQTGRSLRGHYVFIDYVPYIIVCPDTIRQSYGDINDQSKNVLVWQEAKGLTIDRLYCGVSVIIDATNVDVIRRGEFLAGLPPCRKLVKIFSVNPEEAYRRIKKDLDEGKQRSKVPEGTVYRMYGEFLYTLRVIASEGFEFLNHSGKIVEK